MTKTELTTTLREMWETRPTRPNDGRQLAGVAVAVARRYDIDPVLVRVGFVVSAFAGIGAALYIGGWIALPADADDAATRPAPRPILVVGLIIATIAGLGAIADPDFGALIAGLLAAGLLVVLHRNRAHLGGRSTPAGVAPGETPPGAQQPPAWDPLGVAPYAWDLPSPPPAPSPPPGPRVTAVTLAVALLAGGITGLVLLFTGGGAGILLGVLLAVLGGGLVAGAFLHAGRGLLPIALVTAAVAWAVVASPFDRWSQEVQDQRFAPAAAAAVLPSYDAGVGSFELDLRGIDLTVPAGTPAEPLHTAVRAEAGDVQILVPADADVTLHGDVGFGHVGFGERNSGGPDSRLDIVDDLGADGLRSGRPIVLDVTAGLGNVEVHRG